MTTPAEGDRRSRRAEPAVPRSTGPELTAREREILASALAVVQEFGYDRMSVDEVASRARASKSTVYRRWPSKADLVLAAVTDGIGQKAVAPETGSLRGDLLALGRVIVAQARLHSRTLVGVLPEVRRNPALSAFMEREFVDRRKAMMDAVMAEAAERGEIDPAAITGELWDLLPGYLVFRGMVPGREPTEETIVRLVDDVLLPSLTRRPPRGRRSKPAAGPASAADPGAPAHQ